MITHELPFLVRPGVRQTFKVYKWLCILFANTTLLFVFANLVCFQYFKPKPVYHGILDTYASRPEKEFHEIYPGWTLKEVTALLQETWEKPFQYEPWTGFREKPRTGKYVNISNQGFRYSEPTETNLVSDGIPIYFFGGSTAFGYNLDDLSTIPAHLQKHLARRYPNRKIKVFNFGRAYYYSAQEFVLLDQLLRKGFRPKMVIFFDGLNEGQSIPFFSHEMSYIFDAYNYSPQRLSNLLVQNLPMIRSFSKPRVGLQQENLSIEQTLHEYLYNREQILRLSKQYGISTYFFLQPVPGYKNAFYSRFKAARRTPEIDERTINKGKALDATVDNVHSFSMTGILQDYPHRPFVDRVHYTSRVCNMIAALISEKITMP